MKKILWATLLGVSTLVISEEVVTDKEMKAIEENMDLLENIELMDLFLNYEEISLLDVLEDLEE